MPPKPLADEEKPRNLLPYIIVAALALGCGYLSFNFSWILKVHHVHISLGHHHKHLAFASFIGSKYTEDMQDLPKVVPEKTDSKPKEEEDPHIKEITRILSTRVCGDPAIDGYAHVVPKCLEDSPTAKWWADYYKAGGKQQDLVVHMESAADYDGLAVMWGLKNTMKTPEECAEKCKQHMPNVIPGPFEHLPCNAFVWCPDDVCFEPDAHHHTKGDCWLKFTEGPVSPQINMRGDLPDDYRARHPTAPKRVQWVSGVLLPPGVKMTNGTWGPRWSW